MPFTSDERTQREKADFKGISRYLDEPKLKRRLEDTGINRPAEEPKVLCDVAAGDSVAGSEARLDPRGIGRQLRIVGRSARRTSSTRAKADDSTAASGSARSASRRNTGTTT